MRLAAIFSLSIALLLSSVSARLSISDSCGSDSLVLSQKTFQFENQEIKVVTTSCPGLAALRNITRTSTLSSVRKRAVTQCGTTCNSITCDTTDAQPVLADCNNLTNALIKAGGQVTVPAGATVSTTSGTCKYTFANLDKVSYSVCESSFGVLAQNAVTSCFDNQSPTTTITAGFCISPETAGNDFIVESGHS